VLAQRAVRRPAGTCPALPASTAEVPDPFVRHPARPGERNRGVVAFLLAFASNLASEPPERSPGEHREASRPAKGQVRHARNESVGARIAARTAGYSPAIAPTDAAPNTPAMRPAIGSATTDVDIGEAGIEDQGVAAAAGFDELERLAATDREVDDVTFLARSGSRR
jgi:hypothetical protein